MVFFCYVLYLKKERFQSVKGYNIMEKLQEYSSFLYTMPFILFSAVRITPKVLLTIFFMVAYR